MSMPFLRPIFVQRYNTYIAHYLAKASVNLFQAFALPAFFWLRIQSENPNRCGKKGMAGVGFVCTPNLALHWRNLCSRIRTTAYLLVKQDLVSRDPFHSFFFPSASLPEDLLACPPQAQGIHFPNPPTLLANLAPLQSSLSTVSNSTSLLLFFSSSWP